MTSYHTLNVEHATACQQILNACFKTPWQTVGDILKLERTLAIGAFENNTLTGFIIISQVLDTAEILNLAVHPTHQRKGIATHLMLKAIAELETNNVSSLFLDVNEENMQAINLYKNLHFKHTGTRKNYYAHPDGTYKAAYIMELALNS